MNTKQLITHPSAIVGAMMFKYCLSNFITQFQMGKDLGYGSKSNYSKCINGDQDISYGMMKKYFNAMNISIARFELILESFENSNVKVVTDISEFNKLLNIEGYLPVCKEQLMFQFLNDWSS